MRWRAGVRGAHRSSASRKLVPASAPLRRRLATAPPACKGSAREGAAISAIGLSGSGRKWVLGSSSSGAMASGDRQGQWQLCLAVFIDASSISTTRTKNVFELSLIIPCRPAGARARARLPLISCSCRPLPCGIGIQISWIRASRECGGGGVSASGERAQSC